MIVRRFKSFEEMTQQVATLLAGHLRPAGPEPQGIMLSGGLTPLPAYRMLAARAETAAANVHVLYSDERMVPKESPENNYANTAPLVGACRVPEARILRVHTELRLEEAADRYNRDLRAFVGRGGRLALGLLGLGADGHTASLFSMEDIARGEGRFAVAVPRPIPPYRVSVTAEFLRRFDQLIFLVSGPDKSAIARTLVTAPDTIPAGRAVAGANYAALWIS